MKDIAEKFKSIGREVQSTRSSSSLFGDSNLSRAITVEKTRIGFYPIISKDQPNTAMGIASCLSYLLDQYSEFRVYRVFAKIDNQSDTVEIIEDDYQFTPDDWEFVGLDDNVTIYGTIQKSDKNTVLEVTIDSHLTNEKNEIKLSFVYENILSMVANLSEVAHKVANVISDTPSTELIITYKDVNRLSDSQLSDVLENVFYWNLDLYLHLWGVEWSDEEILNQYKEIISLCKSLDNYFVIWCVSMMARQVMQIGLDIIGELIVPVLHEVIKCDKSNVSSAILSVSLANMGYVTQAVDMIEQCTKNTETSLELWFSIINVYLKANQFQQALENNQLAIELGFNDYRLYWMYHQLLNFAENNDTFVEELLLIDPNNNDIEEDEEVIYEIIEALKAGLKQQNENQIILYTLIKYLVDVEHDDLWEYFTKLLNSDIPSQQIRDSIERFYDLDNLAPAFEILEENKINHPDNPNILIYLAQLELVDGESSTAKDLLEQAIKSVDPQDSIYIEIQRLLLSATIDDFESRYSDILVMLDANKNVPEDDVDLLESAIEIAPQFADIYVALARCYLQWNDTETAIEVLADAEGNIGKHPRISQVSSSINWRRGDQEIAIQQLNEALKESPNDIALLTQISSFLIENKQFQDSKNYIERAETIAPSHPEVWKLRKLVATNINR